METQRNLRGVAFVKKQDRKLAAIDRLRFWLSTSRTIDGLWVGTTEGESSLRRVEDALQLIKHHDSLHYSRVIHNLERIWVHLIPGYHAWYDDSLRACVLDQRFVLLETTTLEELASTIVHEATHARLERWGIHYDEDRRIRIEAVCIRRELNFIAKLPHGEPLREERARALEWCISNQVYFSDVSFQQRDEQGRVEAARYLGIPDWLIRLLLKVRAVISGVHRLLHRFAGPPRQA